jgi:hypothetical protein
LPSHQFEFFRVHKRSSIWIAIAVDRNERRQLEPAMRSGPGRAGKTACPWHLPCMPRMKKQSAHARLAVGVSLQASHAHEIQTVAVCLLIFCMDVARHGPKSE